MAIEDSTQALNHETGGPPGCVGGSAIPPGLLGDRLPANSSSVAKRPCTQTAPMILPCPKCQTRIPVPDGIPSNAPIHCIRCETPIATSEELERAPRVIVENASGDLSNYCILERLTIGRDPLNVAQLLDGQVSRNHAKIEKSKDGLVLTDEGSRNGTYLNGQRVRGPELLSPGDQIQVGTFSLILRIPGEENPSSTPPPRSRPRPGLSGRSAEGPGSDPSGTHGTDPFSGGVIPDLRKPRPSFSGQFLHGLKLDGSPGLKVADALASICLAEVDAPSVPLTRSRERIRENTVPRGEYNKLLLAFQMNEELKNINELPRLLRRAMDVVFELFPASRGAILLADKEGNLVPSIVKRRNQDSDIADIRLSQTLIDRAIDGRKAILTQDALEAVGTKSILMENVDSAMTVPLIVKDRLTGVLHIDSSADYGGSFSREDLEILSGIGAQIALAIEEAHLTRKVEEETEARRRLGRYMSPAIVEQVVSTDLAMQIGGSRQQATIVFSDIRGFTAMSENLSPEDVVSLLNEYFELMVDIIFQYQGTLDKFIGDAIMANWGIPIASEHHALDAVRACLDMQRELELLNARRQRRGEPAIEVGIGVNTGAVLAGNIGSTKRMEYTVIGDTVNVASRLCGVAAGGEIIISEYTFAKIGKHIKATRLPDTALKGKAHPIKLYKVVGLFDDPSEVHEDRLDERMKVALPVTWFREASDEAHVGTIENISIGGCALQAEMSTENAFRYNEKLKFDVQTPEAVSIRSIHGRVVGIKYICNSRSDVYYDLNIQFRDLTSDQKSLLDGLLTHSDDETPDVEEG